MTKLGAFGMTDINQLLDDLEAKAKAARWENQRGDSEFKGPKSWAYVETLSPDVTLALIAALRAVFDLHQPEEQSFTDGLKTYCKVCDYVFPCRTRRAITEALSGTGEAP